MTGVQTCALPILITTRRIIFTPSVDVKDELKNTSIQITCIDEEGNVLKRVTSGDNGDIEDSENTNAPSGNGGTTGNGTTDNGGSNTGGNNGGGGGDDEPDEN